MARSVSSAGLTLIKKFEGFIAAPTEIANGLYVVGHGHVRAGEPGAAVTAAEAEALLVQDLQPIVDFLNANVVTNTQSQFDALASFVFSIGLEAFAQSAVLRRLQAGQMLAAANAMDAWRKSEAGGELEVLGSLVRRRAAEKAIFLKGASNVPAPSAFLRPQMDHAMSILGAPIAYAATPALNIAAFAPAIDPAKRITEILMSEPATAALLLTQVVVDENDDDDGVEEIVTAHAKPVARAVAKPNRFKVWSFKLPNISLRQPVETFGLAALLAFGFGMAASALTTLFAGQADLVDIMGASALGAPGVLAISMASFGLMRGPMPITA
jgi:GH24 family phage-related lysozyme (muramidase)